MKLVNISADNEEVKPPIRPDLFLTDSNKSPFRDNRDMMGHPLLSLQKRRVQPIVYHDAKVRIRVGGDVGYGLATIWD